MLAKLRLVLTVLDQSPGPEGLRGNPGWMLHPLKGDMAGFWSIRVTGNWRLVFRFENHKAVDVDLARLASTRGVQERSQALFQLQPACKHQPHSRNLVDYH